VLSNGKISRRMLNLMAGSALLIAGVPAMGAVSGLSGASSARSASASLETGRRLVPGAVDANASPPPDITPTTTTSDLAPATTVAPAPASVTGKAGAVAKAGAGGNSPSKANPSGATGSLHVPTVNVAATAHAVRRQPTSAEVQAAITGLHRFITFYTPTATQVAQVGDQVCTAFDQGQTFAQVKATALQKVAVFFPVSQAAADYAVRTEVSLYCPANASKLV